jgi:hypothetical protein
MTPKPPTKAQIAFTMLREQCRLIGLPEPEPEVQFAKATGRKWRFDAAWTGNIEMPDTPTQLYRHPEPFLLAVEIDGGVFSAGGGRHNRGAGYRADCEKFAQAAIDGWHVIRVLPDHVKNGQALTWIQAYFAARGIQATNRRGA